MKRAAKIVGWCLVPLLAMNAPLAAQGKKYALLVGVNDYQHQDLPALRYAENDVVELAKVLRQNNYRVTLLCDSAGQNNQALRPNKANIDKQLKDILRLAERSDSVVVAFAGHGTQFEKQAGDEDEDAYFCPLDSRPFRSEKATMVSLRKVYQEMNSSFAAVKLLLVDACRNDPKLARGTRSGIDLNHAPRPPRGVAAMFSCSSGEVAHEHQKFRHGVFFHFVLEGLRGQAKNTDGEVTFNSLADFVSGRVSRTVPALIGDGAKQSPNQIGNLQGASPVLLKVAMADPASLPKNPNPSNPKPPANGPLLQGRYVTEATERLTNQLNFSNKQGFQLQDNIFSVGGRWLPQSQSSFAKLYKIQLTGGVRYRFIAAGDHDAKDVDIDVQDSFGKTVASELLADPTAVVDFTPPATDFYTVRVRLYDSQQNVPCVCLGVVLALTNKSKGQQGRFITQATLRFTKLIDAANRDGYYIRDNEFSIGGGWLTQSQTNWVSLYIVTLAVGQHTRVVAAGDTDAKDVDLDVQNPFARSIASDVGLAPTAVVNFTAPTEGRHTIRLRLYSSASNLPCFCIAVVMSKR